MTRARRYQPSDLRRDRSREPAASQPPNPSGASRSTRARPSPTIDDNEYEEVLAAVLEESHSRSNGGASEPESESNTWCVCRRSERVIGSQTMYACDDPDCDTQWYHDICLTPWELRMAARSDNWICAFCFDTRRAVKMSSGTAGEDDKSTQRSPRAAKRARRSRKHNTQRKSQQSATRKKTEPEPVPGEPFQETKLRAILANRKGTDIPRVRTMAEKMAEVDAQHRRNNTWFFEDNRHNDSYIDTETGFKSIPTTAGETQVQRNFANEPVEKKRMSLEAAARRATNHLTRVEKGSGQRGDLVFKYQHGEDLHGRDLTGPVVIFTCDSYQGGATVVHAPIRLLAKMSEAFEQLADYHVWDPPEDEVVARMTLPSIEKPVMSQVIEYLRGGELEIRAQNRLATAIDPRNFSRAVQISSLAHLLGIKSLQRASMHGLWHFLVCYKQPMTTEKLEEECRRLFHGCPAKMLLDECLRRQNLSHTPTRMLWSPKLLFDPKGIPIARNVVSIALCPAVEWKWDSLTPAMWTEVCKNRRLREHWRNLGSLKNTRKSFRVERLRIKDADPFWRPGGARGAILTSSLPLPKVPEEDLLGWETPWLRHAGRLPLPLSPTLPADLSMLIDESPAIELNPASPAKPVGSSVQDEASNASFESSIRFCLAVPIRKIRKLEVIPTFKGFDAFADVFGDRILAAAALFQYSEKYEEAVEEDRPDIYIEKDFKPEALVWIAEHTRYLAGNAGKVSNEGRLAGLMQIVEAVDVAHALQMSRLQTHLNDRLRTLAIPT